MQFPWLEGREIIPNWEYIALKRGESLRYAVLAKGIGHRAKGVE